VADATLNDIKKILEGIAAQSGGTSMHGDESHSGGGRGRTKEQEEAGIKAAADRVELAKEEYEYYDKMHFAKKGLFQDAEKAALLNEAQVELERAKVDLLNQQASAIATYNKEKLEENRQELKAEQKRQASAKRVRKNQKANEKGNKNAYAYGRQMLKTNTDIAGKVANIGLKHTAVGRTISKSVGMMSNLASFSGAMAQGGMKFTKALIAAGPAGAIVLGIVIAISVALLPLAIGGAIIGGLLAIAAWMIKSAIDARDTAAAFRLSTGATMEFGKEIIQVSGDLAELNIGTKEVSKAYGTLYQSTTIFSLALPEQRKRMAATVAVLEKWGISAGTTAKSMEILQTSLGVSTGKVGDTMLELKKHAESIGQHVGAYMEQFGQMAGSMAVFDDGVDTFKRLAAVQKITGMEMRKILDLTNKFDTFEDAAKMSGKLNAALGGNFVNAMDMMTETDPVERFKMIRNALRDGGLEFENMSYYQKRFYMSTLGLKDVSELAVVMRGDISELGGDYAKSADELLAAREETQRYQSVMETLKGLLMKMQPVLDELVDPIQKWVDSLVGKDGATQGFKDLQATLTMFVKEALMPFLRAAPKMTTDFLTVFKAITKWVKENEVLIKNLAKVMTVFLVVLVKIGEALLKYFSVEVMKNIAFGQMLMGDAEQAAKTREEVDKLAESQNKYALELARAATVAGGSLVMGMPGAAAAGLVANLDRVAGALLGMASAETAVAKAANEEHSLSFNQVLEFMAQVLGTMPGLAGAAGNAITGFSRALPNTASHLNNVAGAMMGLKDAFLTDLDEVAPPAVASGARVALDLVPRALAATMGAVTAGRQAPAPATAPAAASQNTPLVKQPIEITFRTEEGALGKQIINVLGKEIQSVIG